MSGLSKNEPITENQIAHTIRMILKEKPNAKKLVYG